MTKNESCYRKALIDKYTPLLCKIAYSFEFNHIEVNDLVKQVDSSVNAHSCVPGNDLFKMWISKHMVQRCISKLSYPFFDQSDWRNTKKDSSAYFSDYLNRNEYNVGNMPLTIRSVFILNKTTDFSEAEIAELLNIAPAKVKERLHKASVIINELSR
jgi:DNA-directed RNA polymerase specialized sigma24 family protein